MEENRTYRIRTKIGDDSDKVINIKLDQHYDSFEILSLKINQSNNYKFYESDYGVVVGRVLANGGFGIPNAKVSIFIESDDNDDMETRIMYPYKSVNAKNQDGVRYNLLTDFLDKACYQNVGTFPNKRYVLDNNDVIDVFDKYYRYTTVTNNAGDYMIFGVPTGSQRLHVDIDLSDIGMLSQRPRDMIYKGYNINQFESPNKFKQDTNLNSLAQIISQDLGLYVYPYWGDTSETDDNIAVTRADINVDYKFEPTCVFMGSIITDTGSNAIGKNCTSTEKVGKMSELIAGEGSIEMIRKTIDGKVEEFQVKGNRVIDGDGVWCYQIPMNLDYIMTDEFGNIVPSDNPEKGIPTRTRVRFRISVDDAPDDNTARKRCRYLVPNNPRLDEELYPNFTKTKEVDYEFGTRTRDENYRDLLWNKVYTVKNYVPRLQKNRKITDRKHTGIKLINHHEANNPMPYNNVDIKLGFTYRLLCVIFKIFINLVQFLNQILTAISLGFCAIYKVFDFIADKLCFSIFGIKPLCWMAWPFRQLANFFKALIVPCVAISSEMCSGNTTHNNTFYPGCGNLMFSGAGAGKLADCIRQKTTESHVKKENKKIKDGEMDESERTTVLLGGTEELYNCVETALAEDNDTVSLNFQNDWVNGTLYAPMWFRKIQKKRTYLFGLIKRRAKDQWCEGEKDYTRKILRVFNPCSPVRKNKSDYVNFSGKSVTPKYMDYSDDKKRYKDSCGDKCHEKTKAINLDKGLIVKRQTMLGQDVYYYKPVEYSSPLTSLIDKVEDFAVNEKVGNDEVGSVKLLFATDIVLLGSLNDCDMHGVPQFFKSLESTTFQLPPNLLFTDNEITVTMKKGTTGSGSDSDPDNVKVEYEVTESSSSEMTGMDWGNFNEDICGKWNDSQDSGLFYSIGCSTIKMKPKSCINMSRICEYGVSLDETKAIFNHDIKPSSENTPSDDSMYDTLIPDGFISKDELYNDDERSLFATLNINGLTTKRNPENGLREYVFKHVVVDNFDASLREYMSERQRKCNKTQKFNYLLEEFSQGYYDFRMGKNPYFYDKNGQFPRYENSFYFYFGLNAGKTAIDKFNSQFTSNCMNDGEDVSPISIDTKPNSWCVEMDLDGEFENSDEYGYAAFDLSLIDLPCDIIIRSTTNSSLPEIVIKDNDKEKFYISKVRQDELENDGYARHEIKLPYDINSDSVTGDNEFLTFLLNGTYELILTDSNGEIITTEFKISPSYIKSYIVGTDFYEPDNVIMPSHGNDRSEIIKDKECLPEVVSIDSTRGIGGTIAISWPYDEKSGERMGDFVITIDNDNMGYHVKIKAKNEVIVNDPIPVALLSHNDEVFIFGVPKGGEVYKVKIMQLCGDNESDNVYEEDVLIKELAPYKLYINGTVDYDVIKHWKSGFDVESVTIGNNEKEGTANIKREGGICNKWWHMSKPENYLWYNYIPYQDIDKELCELAKTYINYVNNFGEVEGVSVSFKETIGNLLSNTSVKLQGNGHFLYSSVSDDGFNEVDINGVKDELTLESEEIEGVDFSNEIEQQVINDFVDMLDEMIELLNEVEPLKNEFINNTKSAFQLNCSESQKSIFFTVDTKDRPVTFHGVYAPEAEDEDTNLFRIEDGYGDTRFYYTREGENIDLISIPTISHVESERFSDDSAESKIAGNICYAKDNAGSEKHKYCNFIAVINSRGKTIPNDAIIDPALDDDEPCGKSEWNFTDKKITDNYFGYHIIDKIFENRFMMWSYFDRIPYYKPMNGECFDESKAGASICMNGLFASKIFNGNATGYRTVYVYNGEQLKESAEEPTIFANCYTKFYKNRDDDCDIISEDDYIDLTEGEQGDYMPVYIPTSQPDKHISEAAFSALLAEEKAKYTKSEETVFEEQRFSPYNMVIYTGRNDDESDADVEDKMPTVRYAVGADGGSNIDMPFKNYRVTSKTDEFNEKVWGLYQQQYVGVNRRSIDMNLRDQNGCMLTESLDGRMKIVLSEDSINLCSTDKDNHKKNSKFSVSVENPSGDNITYFVFSVDTVDGIPYPLNDAKSINDCDDLLCRQSTFDMKWNESTDETDEAFSKEKPKNLFSYYTNPVYNGKTAYIGNVPTREQLESKYIDPNTDKETATKGYGNTGEFKMEKTDNPYFVVAISDNNSRAISPVYDFSYVCAKLVFGVIYSKQETMNEDGLVDGYEYISSPKMTFDVANAIKKHDGCNHTDLGDCVKEDEVLYYFYYYPYDIDFEIKLDDVSTVTGQYHHGAYKNNPEGYMLFDLDEHAFRTLYGIYLGSNNKVGKTIRGNTRIIATDYSGLKHDVDWRGCKQSGAEGHGCGYPYEFKEWVSVTWVTNGGKWAENQDIDSAYIKSACDEWNAECGYYNSEANFTKLYTSGDIYKPYDVGELIKDNCDDESGFIGWSTSYDSSEVIPEETVISILGNKNESQIYYAVWSCDFVKVTWEDCDGNEIAGPETVRIGTVMASEDMPESTDSGVKFTGWMVNGVLINIDEGFEIEEDTTFVAKCASACLPSLKFVNCMDIEDARITVVEFVLTVYEDSVKYQERIPIKVKNITWHPDVMGSKPLYENTSIWTSNESFSEGNVYTIEIECVKALKPGSTECCIYADGSKYVCPSPGDDSGLECTWATGICEKSSLLGLEPVTLRENCLGAQTKVVLTGSVQDDCSCTTPFTVRWMTDCENDVVYYTNYVCIGDYIELPPRTPNVEGKIFNGWDDGHDGVILNSVVTSDTPHDGNVIKICAIWDGSDVTTYTVEFYADSLHMSDYDKTVEENTRLSLSDIPSNESVEVPDGKTWDGKWTYKTDNGGGSYEGTEKYDSSGIVDNINITKNTRFVAEFVDTEPAAKYKFSFYKENVLIESFDIDAGMSMNDSGYVVTDPLDDGKTFIGWMTDGMSDDLRTSEWIMAMQADKSYRFDAKYTVTVKFSWNLPSEVDGKDINGDVIEDVPTQTLDAGSSAISPTNIPVLNGFVFEGWKIDGVLPEVVIPNEDIGLTIIEVHTLFIGVWNDTNVRKYPIYWRIKNYTNKVIQDIKIKLGVSFGSGEEMVTDTAIASGGGIPAYDPSSDAPGERNNSDITTTKLPSSWDRLYAYSAVMDYTYGGNTYYGYTLTKDSGLLISHSSMQQGGTYVAYTQPFVGTSTELVIELHDEPEPVAHNILFKVRETNGDFERVVSTITRTFIDSYMIVPSDIPTASKIISFANNGINGRCTFLNGTTDTITWMDDNDPIDDIISDDSTYIAVVKYVTHTATFKWVKSEAPDINQSVIHGDNAIAPEVIDHTIIPSVDGWSFNGWDPNPNDVKILSDFTFIAQWTKSEFTVKFYGEDNITPLKIEAVEYGGHATPPDVTVSDPTTRRFKNAWIDRADVSSVIASEQFQTMEITKNMEFDARFVNLYKVIFYTADDVQIGNVRTVEENGHVTPPSSADVNAVIASTGKVYMGNWRYGGHGLNQPVYENSWFASNGINSNMNFYARLSCAVSFDFNQPSLINPNSKQYEQRSYLTNDDIPIPDHVEDCTFVGWDNDPLSTRINENITFTAQWDCEVSITAHTVRFLDNGSVIKTIDVADGNTIIQQGESVPSGLGQNFVGWVCYKDGVRDGTKSNSEVESLAITSDYDFLALYNRNYTITYKIRNELSKSCDADPRSCPEKLTLKFGYTFGGYEYTYDAGEIIPPSRNADKILQFTIGNFDRLSVYEIMGYNQNVILDEADGWYYIEQGVKNFAYYKLGFEGDYSGTTYNPDDADGNVVIVIRIKDTIEQDMA